MRIYSDLGKRSAGFIGWLLNIQSLKLLFREYVSTKKLQYLFTYKLSQDPLKNFFNSIRASLGYNNNPTVYQFLSAFRRLLAGAMNKSDYGNCIWDDSISLLQHGEAEEIEAEYDLYDDLELYLRKNYNYCYKKTLIKVLLRKSVFVCMY